MLLVQWMQETASKVNLMAWLRQSVVWPSRDRRAAPAWREDRRHRPGRLHDL